MEYFFISSGQCDQFFGQCFYLMKKHFLKNAVHVANYFRLYLFYYCEVHAPISTFIACFPSQLENLLNGAVSVVLL